MAASFNLDVFVESLEMLPGHCTEFRLLPTKPSMGTTEIIDVNAP